MPTMDLDGFQRLLWSFAGHRVITVAVRAGVLRRLADGAATTAEVARDLGLDPQATGKVVRALHALGLVASDGDAYSVVDGLVPYFRPGPDDLTPFVEHAHGLYDRWGANLEQWLRGEEWQTQPRSDAQVAAFGAAMRAMGSQVAKKVARRLRLQGARRMLDVGGGFGHFSRELCRVQPQLCATVLDTPEVVARAARDLAGSDLGGRIEFVAGDYLSSDYGAGFDLVLYANVLHQEQAREASGMIRRGAAALAPGGELAVVDFTIDDAQRLHLQGCLFAVNMRSFGDTHTEPSIRGWMEAAGLAQVRRWDLDPDRWLIVGRKGR